MINRLIDKVGRKLLGNSLWLFIDKVVRLLVGLFIGVLVARYLGPERMGIWNYCLAIFTFFIIFPSLGLEYVSPREFVNREGETEKLLNTVLKIKFVGATFGVVFAVLFMGFFKGFSNDLIPLIFILTSGYLFQSVDVIDYYYQARLEQKKSVIVRMVAFLLVSCYKFYLVQSNAPLIYFVASSTIDFFLGALGLMYSFRKAPISIKLMTFDVKLAKDLLRDSLIFSISALVVILYYKVDQIMITELLGDQQNGIYSISIRIYELFTFLPAVLVSSFLPVITQKFKENEVEFRASLKQLYSLVTYMAIAFTIIVWIFGPWFMDLLYGADYKGSGEVLQVIGLGFYFAFMGMANSNYLIVRNLKKFILFKSVIGLLLNIGFNLWLIPKMGIMGAAISSIISNFVSTFLIFALKENHSQLELTLAPFNISSIKRFIKY